MCALTSFGTRELLNLLTVTINEFPSASTKIEFAEDETVYFDFKTTQPLDDLD